jgi:A/G-specific adenine glycosylase
MGVSIELFQRLLLEWWQHHARDYPWRHTRTLYRTVIAELMLRRTQADQVVPVYLRFLKKYPTLKEAASARPEEIKKILYSLGLAWRADGIVKFLQEAYARFGNNLPANLEQLRDLPGIGEYVSAAAVCFADGQAVSVIDTNVVRVLGRIFGLDTHGEARRRKPMRELANRAVDRYHPAEYNYALLDFAAKVCTARKPRCHECPFHEGNRCIYYRTVVATGNADCLEEAKE